MKHDWNADTNKCAKCGLERYRALSGYAYYRKGYGSSKRAGPCRPPVSPQHAKVKP